MEVYIINSND